MSFGDDTLDPANLEENRLAEENKRLKAAIRKHRDAKVDDRCWLDDLELYKVLGEPVPDNATDLPPCAEFLGNCLTFWKSRKKRVTYNEPRQEIVDAAVQMVKNHGQNAAANCVNVHRKDYERIVKAVVKAGEATVGLG